MRTNKTTRSSPGADFFFPLEEAATAESVLEPADIVGDWFCCFAIIATALKNKGESVNIPGTHE